MMIVTVMVVIVFIMVMIVTAAGAILAVFVMMMLMLVMVIIVIVVVMMVLVLLMLCLCKKLAEFIIKCVFLSHCVNKLLTCKLVPVGRYDRSYRILLTKALYTVVKLFL